MEHFYEGISRRLDKLKEGVDARLMYIEGDLKKTKELSSETYDLLNEKLEGIESVLSSIDEKSAAQCAMIDEIGAILGTTMVVRANTIISLDVCVVILLFVIAVRLVFF